MPKPIVADRRWWLQSPRIVMCAIATTGIMGSERWRSCCREQQYDSRGRHNSKLAALLYEGSPGLCSIICRPIDYLLIFLSHLDFP